MRKNYISCRSLLDGNERLTEIHLPKLASIAYGLAIHEHDSLTSIHFPKLKLVGGDLEVEGNPNLPNCQVEALYARLLAYGFDGEVEIYGNGTGTCD